jgi:hypothetical protein
LKKWERESKNVKRMNSKGIKEMEGKVGMGRE